MSKKVLTLKIDGKDIYAKEGQSVLQAALEANIYIPNLCSHPSLPVQAGCKLCVAEIDGEIAQSCETAVREGMIVHTKTDDITRRRNLAMELILAGHPKDCTSCKVYLKCELQALMQYMGTVHSRMRTVQRETNMLPVKNPLILREMERCVQCGRCVRACENLREVGVLNYLKQNTETYIGTKDNLSLSDAGCRYCGACVEVCPTGALQDVEGVFSSELPKSEALVPCQAACPANVDVAEYVRLIGKGDSSLAHGVLREKIPFPHSLGYICNHRCETDCKRSKLNSPISIRNLKRYAVEHDESKPWREKALAPLAESSGKNVAIIGAGPCGLTAALYLKKKGHMVTVFERLPMAGGQLVAGIPEFRLPLEHVCNEIEFIKEAGVKILTDNNIIDVTKVKSEFDAVLVAVGANKGKTLRVEGSAFDGTYSGLEFLRDVRMGSTIQLGETINVIGGGNVAFDCARTLRRMGKNVNLVCLEKGSTIPADIEEVEEAIEEGVKLFDGTATVRILGTEGKVSGHTIVKVANFNLGEEGAAIIDTGETAEETILCDGIIFAVGQGADIDSSFGLELNQHGYPSDGAGEFDTNIDGIFAAGDIKTGTRFVVEAIKAGRDVAAVMDKYLGGDGAIGEVLVERSSKNPHIGKIDGFADKERCENFYPTSESIECAGATGEACRCLQCDLRKDIPSVKLWTEYVAK